MYVAAAYLSSRIESRHRLVYTYIISLYCMRIILPTVYNIKLYIILLKTVTERLYNIRVIGRYSYDHLGRARRALA